jgi:23S rRNA (uracil1939-C5)-methyltransferase
LLTPVRPIEKDLPVELQIEKLVYGGDGLARMPADESGRSKTIFVPFVLPGERVTAEVTTQNASFNRARPIQVLESSPERATPACEYFGACGGCHYQHTTYENQLKIKEAVLRETLRRTARLDWSGTIRAHAAEPWHYRNRTRLHVRHAPFAVGYYRHNSHDLLPVTHCPISSLLIDRAIAEFIRIGEQGMVPARVREVELFANADDSALLVELLWDVEGQAIGQEALNALATALQSSLPQLRGVTAFGAGGNLFPWTKQLWASGATSLDYQVGESSYRVQAGSFFQVNRFLAAKLVDLAVPKRRGALALDLFAGTGLFALALAKSFEKVIAVESSRSSYEDLLRNGTSNIEAVQLPTDQFLRKRKFAKPPDLVVVDPPRAGLGPKVTASLIQLGPKEIAYISCDPATLARDLRMFMDASYAIDEMHMVDLFPQTYHLETVVKLARK